MEAVTIRKKGQITLPSDLRREMGLHEGDVIYFERRGNETVLVRAEDIIARTAGALKKYADNTPPLSPDDINSLASEGIAKEGIRKLREIEEGYDSK